MSGVDEHHVALSGRAYGSGSDGQVLAPFFPQGFAFSEFPGPLCASVGASTIMRALRCPLFNWHDCSTSLQYPVLTGHDFGTRLQYLKRLGSMIREKQDIM